MAHLDRDRLTILALDEQNPHPEESDHLVGCARCRGDLDATRHVVGLARDGEQLRDLPPAPSALWDRIAAEALAPAVVQAQPVVQAEPVVQAQPAPPARPGVVPAPRRPAGRWRTALVALAALVLGAAGTAGVDRVLSGDSAPARVVASAELLPQAGAPSGAHGRATVVDTGRGLEVVVTVEGMPPIEGYYTVWIYDGKNVMIPLGSPGPAALNVPPAGRDLGVFRIVDVSAQALGQQEHGRSMLQGALQR